MTAATGVLVQPAAPAGLGRAFGAALAAVLVTASIGQAVRALDDAPVAPPPAAAPASAAVTESLGGLPMAWAANTGQSDPAVRYLAQGMGYATFLTDTEAVVRLDGAVVRLGFDGAAPSPAISTEAPLAATVSSFAGSDPSKWQSGAATAEVVHYEGAWPGIDMTLRGTGSELEWDLHVAAGADPTVAGMAVTGADRIEVDGARAILQVGDSELPLAIPAVWQTRPDGSHIERTAEWDLDGDILRVIPQGWDADLPGVIDPTLDWSTYLGGGLGGRGEDWGRGIAVDEGGNAYVSGSTSSPQFPTTPGAHDPSYDCCDALVYLVKLAPDGSLVYGTFLAGTDYDSDLRDERVAVDASGNAYVTGKATSAAFPTTGGAYDTTFNGGWDVFVTKLDPSGSSLVFSTLIGGSTTDNVGDLAVDASGAATVTGTTFDTGTDYPTTPGAYDTSITQFAAEIFVSRLDPSGSSLIYSTFLGGTNVEGSGGVAVDDLGNAYIVGHTSSGPDFPTTLGAFDTTYNGGTGYGGGDVFVTRIDPDGGALGYSTFVGGSANDYGNDIAVDASGSAYITGQTSSTGYPTTPGAIGTTYNGGTDAYLTKLAPDGDAVVFSTFLGGSGTDTGNSVAVDAVGTAVVVGETPDATVDYPTTSGAFDTTPNGGVDGFVSSVDASGSSLSYSTLLGGDATDRAEGVAIDGDGHVFVTGATANGTVDFPTTAGALGSSHAGGVLDAFVAKLEVAGDGLAYSTLLGGGPGGNDSRVADVAVDATGVYVTGQADLSFPTTSGAADPTYNGGSLDAFVAKLDPAGETLVYSTLLGGISDDQGTGVEVDATGAVYITGTTSSSGFPTTPGAFDVTYNGGFDDGFVAKIDAAGSALLYSTLLGGSDSDRAYGLALDAWGAAYITGSTSSHGFPATPGAYDTSHHPDTYGTNADVFVTKLAPGGGSLVYSTFVGGWLSESGQGIAIDTAGAAYVVGSTASVTPNEEFGVPYPTTAGAFDTSHNSPGGLLPEDILYDAFVTKVSPSGGALAYSTFLGGTGSDGATAVAVDTAGNATVTGSTANLDYWASTPFPTTAGAYDTTSNDSAMNPEGDAFVSRLNAAGSELVYSTFLGGGGADFGSSVVLDSLANAYVAGLTADSGTDLPTTPDAWDATHNGGTDGFLTMIDSSGSTAVYSTLLGGELTDHATSVARSSTGRVVVGGYAVSSGFPTTAGAFDTTNVADVTAGFVSVFDLTPPPPVTPSGCVTSAVAGALISWYPANPGAQSSLRVACTFGNNPGTAQVSPSYTVHDASVAQYHNGAGRRVTNQTAVGAGATSIQLSTASNGIAGVAGWENRAITGPGIAPGTFVRRVSGAGVATLSRATVAAVAAGASFTLENGHARRVDDASGAAASTTLTSPSANFTAADVGLSISGTGIDAGTTIASVSSATQVVLSAPATLVDPAVTIGATLLTTSTRQVTGATTASTVRVSSSAAGWAATDAGLRVSGVCTNGAAPDYVIPAHVYIASPPSGTDAATTGGLLAGQTECNLTIGEPSATAPLDGDAVAQQAMTLDLSPSLVPGSDECANDQPEGFALVARWYNPGSFQGTGLSNQQPGLANGSPTKVIGQLHFGTAALDFSAFVVERKAATPDDPIGAVHYDLQFPFVPTGLAMCPGSATSPGLGFSLAVNATTASQATLPAGTGRPGTAQVRSILPSASGGYTVVAYVKSDTGITFTPPSAFRRICIYPTGHPNPASFQCGPG